MEQPAVIGGPCPNDGRWWYTIQSLLSGVRFIDVAIGDLAGREDAYSPFSYGNTVNCHKIFFVEMKCGIC